MFRARLVHDDIAYLNDAQDIPRAFFPYFVTDDNAEEYLRWTIKENEGVFHITIESSFWEKTEASQRFATEDYLEYKRLTKRFVKTQIYLYLSDNLNVTLPYGSLTGVRPTKLYYELKSKVSNPKEYIKDTYFVTESRAELIEDCVLNQSGVKNEDLNNVGLFINIPFCPTRCNYCSFISTEVFRVRKELPFYVKNVKEEIAAAREIIRAKGYRVRSIYVGGGTPTSIGDENLNAILDSVKDFGCEFTVEAGRPDTVSDDTLAMLKRNNVTRISINPQTFNQKTLDKIGRKHTVEDIYRAYEDALKYGFDVNMDLIAMLEEETYEDFVNSVNCALELQPQNITVHTLSFKNGSVITQMGLSKSEFGLAQKMVDYSRERIQNADYKPYYMYRQKNTADNLENVGYALKGKQCLYNVDMMEEAALIIGAGAGAMCKLIDGKGKIERFSVPKGFREYCDRIESVIQGKSVFFK